MSKFRCPCCDKKIKSKHGLMWPWDQSEEEHFMICIVCLFKIHLSPYLYIQDYLDWLESE